MEQFYLGQDKNFRREWHSDRVEFSRYFDSFSNDVQCVKGRNFNYKSVLESILPDTVTVDTETLQNLKKLTCEEQLKPKVNYQLIPINKSSQKKHLKKIGEFSKWKECKKGFGSKEESNVTLKNSVMKNELEYLTCSSSKEDDDGFGENGHEYKFERDLNSLRKYQKHSIYASEHNLLKENKNRKDNLRAGEDSLLSIQVYPPFFRHDKEPTPGHFMQEIRVLSSQTLEVLRDKIICPTDFQDVQGDISDRPDTPITFMTRDVYRSAMFYIDNTFYIDKRNADCVDYSNVVRKWALEQDIRVGSTLDMSECVVGKLTLRFGYPYLYLHQGCCEHLIIFNDARLLTGRDSLFDGDYPLVSCLHRPKAEYCIICLEKSAGWIVTGSERMLHDVTHMCDHCFRQFNYKDGKKLGDFKAYRFVDPGALL